MKPLLKFLKPYSKSLVITLVLLFLQSAANLFLPRLMSKIVDVGITNGDIPYILRIGSLMLIAALLGTIFVIVSNLISSKIAMGFSHDLRNSLFSKIEGFSLGEFSTVGTASLITRSTNDITQVQQLILMALRMMVTAPLMIIGGVIMALTTNVSLSVILLVSLPILILVIWLVGRRGIPLFKQMQNKLDEVNLVLRENLMGVRVIRSFNRIPYEQRRFHHANEDLTDNAIKVNKIIALLMPSMMVIMNITTVAILWFGGGRVDQGTLEVGDLIAFTQYVMQIMMSLVMLTMLFVLVPRASASATRISEVLEIPFSIQDSPHPVSAPPLEGYLSFSHVSFTYPGSSEPALHDISFDTKPGEVTAIIGGTGSGKSTLLNLISRFYEVSCGEILVDGTPIQTLPVEVLRQKIGLVPQKAILFSGSIKDNLCFGKENASDEEVSHALEVAQATDFVSRMPEGITSYIAQGGTNVSGGQKQRLSIARALIRKPEIYLFDDSFSALDFKTDAALRKALKTELMQSTMILVAQRVSTIMDADRILVLHDGELVGIGTHQELLQHCPLYKEIALSQLSEEEITNETQQ
ncbi:MAG: ABC transporter ATP-binding protein [Cellulosilyticaceae bacterium]